MIFREVQVAAGSGKQAAVCQHGFSRALRQGEGRIQTENLLMFKHKCGLRHCRAVIRGFGANTGKKVTHFN